SCSRTQVSLSIAPKNGEGTIGPLYTFNRCTLFRNSSTAVFASPPGGWTVCGIVGFPGGKPPVSMYCFNFFGPTVFFIIQSIARIGAGAFGKPSTGNRIHSARCLQHCARSQVP